VVATGESNGPTMTWTIPLHRDPRRMLCAVDHELSERSVVDDHDVDIESVVVGEALLHDALDGVVGPQDEMSLLMASLRFRRRGILRGLRAKEVHAVSVVWGRSNASNVLISVMLLLTVHVCISDCIND
jgi:hypothetical protein